MSAYRRFLVLLSLSCLLVPACSDDSSTQSASGSGAGGTDASGGGGAGASGGGGDATMGASAECQECTEKTFAAGSDCEQAILDCDAEDDCDTWKNCTEACFNEDDSPECYQACEAMLPMDVKLSEALLTCLCDECAMVCAAACSIQ